MVLVSATMRRVGREVHREHRKNMGYMLRKRALLEFLRLLLVAVKAGSVLAADAGLVFAVDAGLVFAVDAGLVFAMEGELLIASDTMMRATWSAVIVFVVLEFECLILVVVVLAVEPGWACERSSQGTDAPSCARGADVSAC